MKPFHLMMLHGTIVTTTGRRRTLIGSRLAYL